MEDRLTSGFWLQQPSLPKFSYQKLFRKRVPRVRSVQHDAIAPGRPVNLWAEGPPELRNYRYSQDDDRIYRFLVIDGNQKVPRASNELHTTAQKT